MKTQTKKEKEKATVFQMPISGCHYATGPPSLLKVMASQPVVTKRCPARAADINNTNKGY